MNQTRMVDVSFSCRRTRDVLLRQPSIAASSDFGGALERIAGQLLEGQHRMMAAMVGDREREIPFPITFAPLRRSASCHSSAPFALPAPPLAAEASLTHVAAPPPLTWPSMPATAPQPPATTLTSDSLCSGSQPHSEVREWDTQSAVSALMVESPRETTPLVVQDDSSRRALDIMDMLDERDQEKRSSKARAHATAKLAPQAGVTPPTKTAQRLNAEASGEKPKAPSKGASGAKATSKAAPVKAKATADASDVGKKPIVKTAGQETMAKIGAQARQIFGSVCRTHRSRNGCARR